MRVILMKSRPLIYFLVVAVFSLSLPRHPAEATLVPTGSAITSSPDTETNRARVRAFLEREDVQAQLEAYRINVDEARARVESLTDDEVAVIAGKLDELPAGADAGLALAAILVGIGYLVVWTFKKLFSAFKKMADQPATRSPDTLDHAPGDSEVPHERR